MFVEPSQAIATPDPPSSGAQRAGWKLLIVDDEPDVHEVTRLALDRFEFEGRGLIFLHAHSEAQAQALLAQHKDLAVALIDVVMETEDAGLTLVRHIRQTLLNSKLQIILRTGQPGVAPERHVIARYEINDYKTKSELSSLKLYSAVLTALRNYRDLIQLDRLNLGLDRLLNACASLYTARTVSGFGVLVLQHLGKLLAYDADAPASDPAFIPGSDVIHGDFSEITSAGLRHIARIGEPEVRASAAEVSSAPAAQVPGQFDEVSITLSSSYGDWYRIQLRIGRALESIDRKLVRLFEIKAAGALNHLLLYRNSLEAQRMAVAAVSRALDLPQSVPGDIDDASVALPSRNRIAILTQLAALAEVPQWGSTDLSMQHLSRVRQYSYRLARHCGVAADKARLMAMAAQLHDIGNLFVSDYAVGSWFAPDDDLRDRLGLHAIAGAEYLEDHPMSDAPELMQYAVGIVRHHHEAWAGGGVPDALSRNQIPLCAQIVAIVDFFDSHTHYNAHRERPAASPGEVLRMIHIAAGHYFSPQIVQIFCNHARQICADRLPLD